MRSFRFSLERVLSWRGTELEREEAQLAARLAERNRLDTVRIQILAARERAGRELVTAGRVDGSDLAALAGYRASLDKDRAANEQHRTESAKGIEAQRERVTAAHRRFRLLEKLKARRLQEWHSAWNREMENFASEAFLSRWRNRIETGPGARTKIRHRLSPSG
jgi:flagellar export protein FliJ